MDNLLDIFQPHRAVEGKSSISSFCWCFWYCLQSNDLFNGQIGFFFCFCFSLLNSPLAVPASDVRQTILKGFLEDSCPQLHLMVTRQCKVSRLPSKKARNANSLYHENFPGNEAVQHCANTSKMHPLTIGVQKVA